MDSQQYLPDLGGGGVGGVMQLDGEAVEGWGVSTWKLFFSFIFLEYCVYFFLLSIHSQMNNMSPPPPPHPHCENPEPAQFYSE